MDSVRKNSERCFGVVKKRFRIIHVKSNLHKARHIDSILKVLCRCLSTAAKVPFAVATASLSLLMLLLQQLPWRVLLPMLLVLINSLHLLLLLAHHYEHMIIGYVGVLHLA